MQDFYKIPFSFTDLLVGKRENVLKTNLQQSIQQHIQLIITTHMGDFRYDASYGCKIWEVDFEVPSNLETWKESIKQSIHDAIIKHENRIEFIDQFAVKVIRLDTKGIGRIHQRLSIELSGKIRGTNSRFRYEDTLYFSPVSLV